MKVNRRTFFGNTLAAALSVPTVLSTDAQSQLSVRREGYQDYPDIIDTNINLFEWPFRRLKFAGTNALVEKLQRHHIIQAWAGSFEALFHKDINGVNYRLAEACRVDGKGMLLPFGTVNLAWPDWEEDLRRCHEDYRMPGIRLYPGYQPFDLHHEAFLPLVQQATERGLIIQIVGDMEDVRTHHPTVHVSDVDFDLLADILKKVPVARVQLLYWNHKVEGKKLDKLITETNVLLDISRVESTGGVGRLIEGKPWQGFGSAKAVPVERLLFGSHAPYFPMESSLLKLFESPLSIKQTKAIMIDNADRFLKALP